jgi:hypothetical protein
MDQLVKTFLPPSASVVISLDRLVASVKKSESVPTVPVRNDPPQIFVSNRPSVLLQLDGQPVLAEVPKTKLKFVVNTNWPLFQDTSQSNYYLFTGQQWLTAANLDGPWSLTSKLPKDFSKTVKDPYGVARGVYGPYGGATGWASYNPYTGTYARGGSVYGPYGSASAGRAYNPYTGTYARGATATTAYGTRSAAGAYKPYTGRGAATRQGSSPYGQWGTSVVGGPHQAVQTGHVTTSQGTIAGARSTTGAKAIGGNGAYGSGGGRFGGGRRR